MIKITTSQHYIDLREAAEEAVANYAEQLSKVVSLKKEIRVYLDRITDLTVALFRTRKERNELIKQRDQARQLACDLEEAISRIKHDPEYWGLKDRLKSKESEIDYLRTTLELVKDSLDNANKNAEVYKMMIAERDKRVEKLIKKMEGKGNGKTTATSKGNSEAEQA